MIDRIVAAGTGCIILDEAHHLLDYWAVVLAILIARLPQALVVGLTATPPASAGPDEMRNYLALVDGIDFEVPTPAVVRSGHLAPYQDLVYVTRPTAGERRFLAKQEEILDDALRKVFDDPRLVPFVEGRVNRADGQPTWVEALDADFDFMVAGVRFLVAQDRPLAGDVELAPEMGQAPGPEDRLALVRGWAMEVLRLSREPADRRTLADLRAVLRTFGLTMTDAGWRPAPSPMERVVAYSQSKLDGMVQILQAEAATMREELRAVVLTDFERSAALALRSLEGVLDPEAGGAVAAFRALVADATTNALDPVMVTGKTVLVDADFAERFLREARAYLEAHEVEADLSSRTGSDGVVEIEGAGAGWRPRHYVACVTELFERGVTRCVVGTRGLLAEGWDSLSLNTLVDLTTAGTFASVNQIRGRSIRLDPNQPRKVADNWDVVCVGGGAGQGLSDLRRLLDKHRHVWGLGPGGRIVKGAAHLHQGLLTVMSGGLIGGVSASNVNGDSMHRAAHRARAYEAWGVGKPYDNFEFRATVLAAEDMTFRTGFSWRQSLRALLNIAVANFLFYLLMFGQAVPRALASVVSRPVVALIAGMVVALSFGLSAVWFVRYFKAAFLDVPIDSSLADFGRAVAETLRSTGMAAASAEQVRVALTVAGTYEVTLASADQQATALFAEAYRDLFTPVVDQRYLVVRDETAIRRGFYAPIWYVIWAVTRLLRRRDRFYHPVPVVFARRRESAEAFAEAWKRWVGGGGLVYTRSPEGSSILLRERARARLNVRSAVVAEWR